jgi:hypothetical protein
MDKDIEEMLLRVLIVAHLENGQAISLKGKEWFYVQEAGDEPNHYTSIGEGGTREWGDPLDVVNDIVSQVKRNNSSFNDVTFHDEEKTGVTWRFLKLDMSFLRIVLGNDRQAIGAITRRLSAILNETLQEGLIDPTLN